ncbi:aldose 1-epimerase [Ensifer sp.]|jgi:aldose 1-epimerase|uniref:aldose 1-epimerase n=1 Tax=Ensifer sp. TaxID=1872086 RepID=UPI002E13AB14|nr:aldose 1-epimerase [Ensifer sp.]
MADDILLLKNDEGLTVEVSPIGGAILSAHWQGKPFLAPTPTPGLASQLLGAEACFPLVPFGNRIEDNRFQFEGDDCCLAPNTHDPLVLHGDGWLNRWTIGNRNQRSLVLHHRQEASVATPFAYETVQAITIDDNRLSLSLAVTNRASRPLPYGLGFHPYFPRTEQMRLFARAARYWTERENHLPETASPIPADLDFSIGATLPERWLNNAFDQWDGMMSVEWPEDDLCVSLKADEPFRHFVLYSPSADAGHFCFEPMTHRPNAHHLQQGGGLVRLEPDESLKGTIVLRVEASGATG